TILQGDWSSDVCSSDLARVLKLGSSRSGAVVRGVARGTVDSTVFNLQPKHRSRAIRAANRYVRLRNFQLTESFRVRYGQQRALKIGRASCRERGCGSSV